MRELTVAEFGVLLSLFAVLLLAFSADFHLTRKQVRSHRRAATVFALISLAGELSAATAMLLTWVALWSEATWEKINDLWVLVPGSIAVLVALILTVEKVVARTITIFEEEFSDDDGDADGEG